MQEELTLKKKGHSRTYSGFESHIQTKKNKISKNISGF